MTRVNVVPPSELTRQHLIAEYRELPRIFTLAEAAYARGEHPPRTSMYVLGTGHVRFFYSRLGWLRSRHVALVKEMHRRGYSTNLDCSKRCIDLPPEWQRGWKPPASAVRRNRKRIRDRLNGKANTDGTR